jgi:recombination protein RecA
MGSNLDAIVAKINKKHGEGTIYRGSQIRDRKLPRITSGSLSLDDCLGGGWAANQWNEVVGSESGGKTGLVYMAIAANQRLDPDFLTVWVAAEEYVHEYADMWGVDDARMIIVDTNVMEDAYEAIFEFLESREVDAIVIDSLPQLIPMTEEEQDIDDWQVGLAARINGKFFRKGRTSMKRSQISEVAERPVTGFIINQWRSQIGVRYGDPRTTPGGQAKDYAFFLRVEVRRDEWIEVAAKKRVGQSQVVRNIKNKTAPPSRYAHFDVYFDNVLDEETGELLHAAGSIDTAKEVIALGTELEIIKRRGAYFDFPDGSTVKGKEALADRAGDPEMVALVQKQIAALRAGEVIDDGPEEEPTPPKPKAGAKDRKPQRRVVQRGKR